MRDWLGQGGQVFQQQDRRDWLRLAPAWPGSPRTPAVASTATPAMMSATPAVASAVTLAVQASLATPPLPATSSELWFLAVPASMAGRFAAASAHVDQ